METTMKPAHIGRKISRIRELRGIKQETLAHEMGVSQQTISRIESSETVEDDILAKVAKILGVHTEAIKNFSEEAAINYFNNFNDNSVNNGSVNSHCTFNPLDKLMEALEENRKLNEESKKLYERLLESEQEKNELLKKMINE